MTMPHQSAVLCRYRHISILALGMCIAANALADDPNPYYVGTSIGYNHDSNVFRLPEATGDSYLSYGLLGGFDQPIGRQRVYANGTVRKNKFDKLNDLDNNSYSLTTGLDWSTVDRISGNLKYSANQSLASYSTTISTLPIRVRNIEKDSELLARAQYGLASLFILDGSLTHRKLDYSAAEYQIYNYDLNVGSIGLKYRPSAALTTGIAYRISRGKYPERPNAAGEAAKIERNDVDLTASWLPTGESTVDARLSYGTRKDDAASQTNFKGSTGSLAWTFQPTGKLSFKTSFTRDTGLETNYLNTAQGQSVGIGDNNTLTNSLYMTANYNVTAKIQATVNAGYNRRNLRATVGDDVVTGNDSTRRVSVGLNYTPTRNSLVGCGIGRESRNANSALSYAYSANTANCSAQITLQ